MSDFWDVYNAGSPTPDGDGMPHGLYIDPDYLRSMFSDEYLPEYDSIYATYLSALRAANQSYHSSKKVAAAVGQAEQAFWDSVSALQRSVRERQQASIATQMEEQRSAGLNPLLNGVDSSAAATAGTGIDTNVPLDPSSLPDVVSDLEIAGDVLSVVATVVATVASVGVGIATTVANIGRIAAQNLLSSEQADSLRQGRMIESGLIAEQYVLDNAPSFDESIGAFPGWKPASIPGVSDDLQSYALERAASYYGSDRHRAGQLSRLSAVEQSRYDLAKLYGSGFYSTSIDHMASAVSRYSKLQLDMIETDYQRQISFNELYDKYYSSLSPEAMADVQNAVNAYYNSYYLSLDASAAAASDNMAALSQVEFFSSYDSSLSAASLNSSNRYNSSLYDSLDADGKAAYDNYFYELSLLRATIVNDELKAQDALYEEFRSNLDSPDPAVRISAARALQRCGAKSARRSSATGWQRFSSGARTVVGLGAAAAGVAAAAGGAGPVAAAAGAGFGAGIMPNESVIDTDYNSVLNGL